MDLLKTIVRTQTVRCFRYPDQASRVDPGAPPDGYQVEIFAPGTALPASVASFVMPGGVREVMWWRFRRGLATLLLVRAPDGTPAAFGWLQSWRPFRRRFRAIATSGRMLGFYRTTTPHRGRGLYHFMLRRSIAMVPAPEPLVIYAERTNEASLRGIERAGFQFVADLRFRRVLGVFSLVRVLTRADES